MTAAAEFGVQEQPHEPHRGAAVHDPGAAVRLVRLFLSTEFAGGRHERRVKKIMALEGQPVRDSSKA